MGVEPTEDATNAPPTDLKSAKPTGTHPLPTHRLVLPGIKPNHFNILYNMSQNY